MMCPYCNAALPASAQFCLSCGRKVSSRVSPSRINALLSFPIVHGFSQIIRQLLTGKQKERKRLQAEAEYFMTLAKNGGITYDIFFKASDDSLRYRETSACSLKAYSCARGAWQTCISHTYGGDTDILSDLRDYVWLTKLRDGKIDAILTELKINTDDADTILAYPGLRHFLARSFLTMILLDMLKLEIVEQVQSYDIAAIDRRYDNDFFAESLVMAQEAQKYALNSSGSLHRDALETFISAHMIPVEQTQRENTTQAITQEVAFGVKTQQLDPAKEQEIIRFVHKSLEKVSKQYELILFVSLLKTKWNALANLGV